MINIGSAIKNAIGNKVYILIQYDADYLLIPVNPKDLEISQSASNSNLDILGIGKAVRKENPGLKSTKIKSFFPSLGSNFNITGVSPEQCIKFINNIWKAQYIATSDKVKVPRILTSNLDVNLNMYFVIDKFTYKYAYGTKDVEYTLQIKQYIPYGSKKVDYMFNGVASARAPSVVSEDVPGINLDETNATTESKTYVTHYGDTLWSIAARCTGNGNNWGQLYELNKAIIGTNPNALKVGITLTLPLGWSAPGKGTIGSSKSKAAKNNKFSSVLDDAGSVFAYDAAFLNTATNVKQSGGGSTVHYIKGKKLVGGGGTRSKNILTQPTKNIYENMSVTDFIIPGMAAFKLADRSATKSYYESQKEKMLETARQGDWEQAAKHKEEYLKWRAQYKKMLGD